MNNDQQSSHSKTKKVLGWIFGVIFLINGLAGLFSRPWASIFSIILGVILLPPIVNFVKVKYNFSFSSKVKTVVVAVLVVIVVFVFPTNPTATTSTNTKPAVTTSAPTTPQAPLTSEQKLSNTVESALQGDSSQFSYKQVSIEADDDDEANYPRPNGSKFLTIDVNMSGSFWDDTSIVTDTGKFSTTLFPQIFALDPNFYDVLIRYYGQTIDQYGNSTSSMEMSYSMDRPLYGKINWSGISSIGNDLHMCAFLRETRVSMSQADQEESYIGCIILPSDVQSTEKAIEIANPQYGDIPQNN